MLNRIGFALLLVVLPPTANADPLDRLIAAVYASEGLIDFDVSWAGWTGHDAVFDLRDVSPQAAPVDVFRALFRTAEALRDEPITALHLAFRGETRFILPGEAFRTIGAEFAWQNPLYTLRTLPEKLLTPDGQPAFGRWSGGVLGVAGEQMEDVNEMSSSWYLEDIIADLP